MRFIKSNMETKINIAGILKDKPEGTRLYSPLFGDVYLSCTKDGVIKVKYYEGIAIFFNNERYYNYPESEPLLFPSKELRDWSKFAWKKGDVLVNNDKNAHVVFKGFQDDTYRTFMGNYYFEHIDNPHYSFLEKIYETKDFGIEIDSDAKTYIKFLEKRLGGKLNLDTLEIEKAQPEFKKGDIAFADYGYKQAVFIVSSKTNLSEGYNSFIALGLSDLILDMGCRMSFFRKDLSKLRLATEEEKQLLFDALAKEGKAWDVEKKTIVDIKKELQFKPFEKVLVRDSCDDVWRASFFSHIKENDGRYVTTCVTWKFCIPYIGNESLLGTTKDVEG